MSLNASNENLFNSLDSSSSSISSNTNPNINNKSIWSNWITWILIFFVLAIFGFNIFNYIAKGTDIIADLSQKIVGVFQSFINWINSLLGNNLSDTAKQTVNISATGAKAGIDAAANTTTGLIDSSSNLTNANTNANTNTNTNTIPSKSYSSNPGQPLQTKDTGSLAENTLNKALNQATIENTVQADDSFSSIQSSKTSGKSGWCFIGEDRGIRSCMQVGANDVCMSGDIFPTSEVCINPNLRV